MIVRNNYYCYCCSSNWETIWSAGSFNAQSGRHIPSLQYLKIANHITTDRGRGVQSQSGGGRGRRSENPRRVEKGVYDVSY